MEKKIILASGSPRRAELLRGLGRDFEIRLKEGIEESYPDYLKTEEVPVYLAELKADAYECGADEIILTADTVVALGEKIYGKPKDSDEACRMLRELSGKIHNVITGVCLKTAFTKRSFSVKTEVCFKVLSEDEIRYYVEHYRPLDKAGAYGIQEWIGYIGCTELRGSYFNVMGLPVQRIYEELRKLGF